MRALRASGAWVGMGLVAMALAGASAGEEPAKKKSGGPPEFERLEFRSIGPAAGGRVTRVAGVPGDPLVYYVATASGGVWKSSDGGRRPRPIVCRRSRSEPMARSTQIWKTFGLSQPSRSAEWEKMNFSFESKLSSFSFSRMIRL